MRNALKVLIVDDDKGSTQALSEVVKRLGMKPVVASKVSDALNIVRLQTVHAAIVDVLLPKMTGVELVQEFRNTRFAENPVVFVSGVFKDKNFASEAIKKTAAKAFLFKPFNVEELSAALNGALQNQISAEKWTVQSLLTRKLSSDRERAKAIEHLEEMKGRDFPFVLGILMEVGSSGSLNIVNDAGEIFGASLVQGAISEVDSTEAQATVVLNLISKGYLSQEDWDDFQTRAGKKFTPEKLIQEGIVSPHAVSEARREQIISDLRAICSAAKLQVNFVPQEEAENAPRHAVKLQDLIDLFTSALDEFFPEQYLTEFYAPVWGSPIRLIHLSAQVVRMWEREPFNEAHQLKSVIEKNGSIEEALAPNPELKAKILQCLHYLVLMRSVMFDDLNRVKSLNDLVERYRKLLHEIEGKTPDKIFEYFGAAATAKPSVFNNIFEEYARSNDPEQLGKEATPELRELARHCYELISEARDVMVDEDQRNNLLQRLKDEEHQRQHRATFMVSEALEMLRKGQAREAVAKVKEADQIHPSNRSALIGAWAEVKAGAGKPRLTELMKKLESLQSEERKNPFFYMAMGLIKKGLGDPTAVSLFEKALQLDPEFGEVRRELSNVAAAPKEKKLDIFNDDLSTVVSQLFRRKAD